MSNTLLTQFSLSHHLHSLPPLTLISPNSLIPLPLHLTSQATFHSPHFTSFIHTHYLDSNFASSTSVIFSLPSLILDPWFQPLILIIFTPLTHNYYSHSQPSLWHTSTTITHTQDFTHTHTHTHAHMFTLWLSLFICAQTLCSCSHSPLKLTLSLAPSALTHLLFSHSPLSVTATNRRVIYLGQHRTCCILCRQQLLPGQPSMCRRQRCERNHFHYWQNCRRLQMEGGKTIPGMSTHAQ